MGSCVYVCVRESSFVDDLIFISTNTQYSIFRFTSDQTDIYWKIECQYAAATAAAAASIFIPSNSDRSSSHGMLSCCGIMLSMKTKYFCGKEQTNKQKRLGERERKRNWHNNAEIMTRRMKYDVHCTTAYQNPLQINPISIQV